jgi:hypothetical protein
LINGLFFLSCHAANPPSSIQRKQMVIMMIYIYYRLTH